MNLVDFILCDCLFLVLFCTCTCAGAAMTKTDLYFAYGSNLLAKRMRRSNPSAVRYGIGILKDHSLDFGTYTSLWRGGGANIIPKKDHNVWGAIYYLNEEDFQSLDRQENVHINMYRRITVQIKTPEGKKIMCQTYQQTEHLPEADVVNLPQERRPSLSYLTTITKGAVESGLPDEYIRFLKSINSNGLLFDPKLGLD